MTKIIITALFGRDFAKVSDNPFEALNSALPIIQQIIKLVQIQLNMELIKTSKSYGSQSQTCDYCRRLNQSKK